VDGLTSPPEALTRPVGDDAAVNSRRPGSILVTGAARGIGRATAKLFARLTG
jgi:hypothetical protein